MSEKTSGASLNLSHLITAVRSELETVEIERTSAGRDPLFALDTMELAVHFVVSEDAAIKGGFDLKIVSLGSKLLEHSEVTHKVTLKYSILPHAKHLPGTKAFPGEEGGQQKDIRPL